MDNSTSEPLWDGVQGNLVLAKLTRVAFLLCNESALCDECNF